MKRLRYSLLVLISFVFMVFGAQAIMAEEGTLDNGLEWKHENGTMKITFCEKDATEITIPASINEIPVTMILEYAFWRCTSLTSVTIPNSVTTIEQGAFRGCSSLTSVTIPDSVNTMSQAVFYNCSSLTSVKIPDSVTTIEDSAFCGCISLTSVTIPNSVTTIKNYAFGYNYNDTTSEYIKVSGFTIYGYYGTEAETYAKNNGFTFVSLKEPVTGVSLNKSSTSLTVGGTETLTATVAPSDATDPSVAWSSSDTSVATVDSNGKVTAVGIGTATITVITTDGSKTATCTVTVKAAESETQTETQTQTAATSTSAAVQEPITIPKTPANVKAKAKKNKVTVSWKKIKKNKNGKKLLKLIRGIHVQYSTDPTFQTIVMTKAVKKNKTEVTLKLKRKTTYYIRVRYVGYNGYSNWSKIKRVKTK